MTKKIYLKLKDNSYELGGRVPNSKQLGTRPPNSPPNSNSYDIVIGNGILKSLGSAVKRLNIGRDAVVITNPQIKRMYGSVIKKSLKVKGFSVLFLTVPNGEHSKSAPKAFELMEKLARYDVFKKVFIVALGGGVIGDLAGYVAAAYKRGIPYIQVPTTFLAQIDSSIGGKTAVDLSVGKNLVGAFHQPKIVFSDVKVLSTLPIRQIRNGLSEAVKYGVIRDPKLFRYLEENYKKVLNVDTKVLTHVVAESSRIKADVVMADEKETLGIRTILNFGHTIGHAIEAAGGYEVYQHGEAIALGMRAAAELSREFTKFPAQDLQRLNDLLTAIGLPQTLKGVKRSDVMRLMKHDKKFISGKTRFVLAKKIGTVKVVEGISSERIATAVKKLMTSS